MRCRASRHATVITFGVMLLAGCASAPPRGAVANASLDPLGDTYSGPVTTTTTLFDGGLRLDPPGDRVVGLSWEQALADLCHDTPGACGGRSGGAKIVLASVTTPEMGMPGPDGSIVPTTKDVISYVVTWTGVPCAPSGPGGGYGPSATPSPRTYVCTEAIAVDAQSGKPSTGEYTEGRPYSSTRGVAGIACSASVASEPRTHAGCACASSAPSGSG